MLSYPIKVVSETSFESCLSFVDNRFVVEGHYKYQYNNKYLAKLDLIAVANNFLMPCKRYKDTLNSMIQDAGHWRRRYRSCWKLLPRFGKEKTEKSEDITGCIRQKDTVGIVTTYSVKGYK